MYVYVWKQPDGTPFYVGMAKNARRFSPYKTSHRNKQCLDLLHQIGPANVIVELFHVVDEKAARAMEQGLILKFGRLKDGTGTLTNISKGGEFHIATEETRQLLSEKWKDPEHKAKVISKRLGSKRSLDPATREKLAVNLHNNPAMKSWAERNGKDPEFDAKRIAGIKAAQGKRSEKMADPDALARRKARLKATFASPEYQEKRKKFDTPEYRAKLAAAKKAYWERKRAMSSL